MRSGAVWCQMALAGWIAFCPASLLLGQRDVTAPTANEEPSLRKELREELEIAEKLEREGKGPEAAARYRGALALAEQLSDARSTADALFGVGKSLWVAGDYTGSLAAHTRALAIRREIGDIPGQALSLNNIGLTFYGLGRHAEALEHYQQALEVNRLSPSPPLEGVAKMNIGLVHRYLGRYREAEEWMEASLRIRRTTGDKRAIGQTLNAMGLLARARGYFQRALDLYAEALPLRREAGDLQGVSQTLNGIGVVLGNQGQHEEAIERYREAQRIAEEIGYMAQVGFSTWNIGGNLASLARHREALEQYEAALAIWRRMGRRADIGRTLYDIGRLRLHLGDRDGARAPLTEALEIAREVGEPEPECRALDSLGVLALETGQPAEALESLDGALALARSSEMLDIEWEVRADRALALRALGRHAETLEELQASVKLINDLRANVGTDAGKIGFLDARREVFDDLVAELTAAGRHAEALEAAEASRARALADLLQQREIAAKPADREALEEFRSAFEESQAMPLTAAAPTGKVASEAERGSDGVEKAMARLRQESEELASLVTVEAPGLAEIQTAAARRNATLVEYHVTKERTFVWLVPPRGEIQQTAVEVGRERLVTLVSEARREIEEADLASLRDPSRVEKRLRELDRLLVAPVARWLPAEPERLVILIPHGPLALLPFAALLDRRGRSLAERHTLALAPAASVLRFTEGKRRRTARGSGSGALIVADPVPPRGTGLERLSGSREESDRVAARLHPVRRLILAGARATEAAVKRASPGRTILHFATHGLVADERPLDSSLLLGEGDGEDGYLRVREVFALELEADLVVLSGCSTGLGRLSGDGILGLTRAFLYAGTPSVVVSYWDVSDRATAFLMERFYTAIRAGRNKAAALRQAQLATRARFRHPALWAAFALVGES